MAKSIAASTSEWLVMIDKELALVSGASAYAMIVYCDVGMVECFLWELR